MIVAYIREHRISPTRREIKAIANLSSLSQVEHHITQLRMLGFITVRPGKLARGIELVEETNEHGKYQDLVEAAIKVAEDPYDSTKWFLDIMNALIKVGAIPTKKES